MATYHFVTRWQVDAQREEVYAILEDVEHLTNWWPAVYLDVRVVKPGKPDGVGKVVELYTKGWLPYTLRWQFRVTDVRFPEGFVLEAFGDLVGRGEWVFRQVAPSVCEVVYDWNIEAEKPLLKYLSFVLRPIFAANHRWAMRKGLESLQLELRRRRIVDDGEQALFPKPPQPTFPHNLTNNRILQGGQMPAVAD